MIVSMRKPQIGWSNVFGVTGVAVIRVSVLFGPPGDQPAVASSIAVASVCAWRSL
jgi:hypothetical protein